MIYIRLLLLTILLFTLSDYSNGQKLKADSKRIKIPFELSQGHIYVDAFVNEQGPFRFLVDTGASGTGRADVSLVKDLGLPVVGTDTNSDGINTAIVNRVAIKSLRIGRLTRRQTEVLSRDYNPNPKPDRQMLMGIIGRDFFSDYLLTINYLQKEITLTRGKLKKSEPGIIHYDKPFHIPLRVGGYDTIGRLDTGANEFIRLPLEWAEKLAFKNLKKVGTQRRANTVSEVFGNGLSIPIEIGGNKITDTVPTFAELPDGINIGSSLFAKNQCEITIDQKNRLIKISCLKSNAGQAVNDEKGKIQEQVSDSNQIKIPFELAQGRIYVEAFVDEQGSFRFMVDTGASGVGRADVRLVKDLGLPVTGTASNSDSVNTAIVETVRIKSLRVGQLARRDVEVLSRDYNSRPAPGSKMLMGIIGREFFSGYLLKIDYKKSELILSRGSLKTSEANVLRYAADNTFVVPLRIGRYDTVGLIDTGSVLEMHLPMLWAEKLKIQTLKDAGEGRRANTVFKLFSAELPVAVNIGNNKITGTEARFSELANRINIGGSFLAKNRCVLTFDQKNNLIKMRCSQK